MTPEEWAAKAGAEGGLFGAVEYGLSQHDLAFTPETEYLHSLLMDYAGYFRDMEILALAIVDEFREHGVDAEDLL